MNIQYTKYKLAVCNFYKNGSVFPLRLNYSKKEATACKAWMQIGEGQFEDWRVISMSELKTLLEAGKVDLSTYTTEAQENMRSDILSS